MVLFKILSFAVIGRIQKVIFLSREHVPKTTAFFDILWDLLEDQFRLIARMTRESFIELVKEIEHNNVFKSNGTKVQAPVWKQVNSTTHVDGVNQSASLAVVFNRCCQTRYYT